MSWIKCFKENWPTWPAECEIPLQLHLPRCPYGCEFSETRWKELWQKYVDAWRTKEIFNVRENEFMIKAESLSKAHSWYKHLHVKGTMLYLSYEPSFDFILHHVEPLNIKSLPVLLNCFFRGVENGGHIRSSHIVLEDYFRSSRTNLIKKAERKGYRFENQQDKDKCLKQIWRSEQERQVKN